MMATVVEYNGVSTMEPSTVVSVSCRLVRN